MPQNKDHCRSCGVDVDLNLAAEEPGHGAVCGGCKKTLCAACQPKSCPHASFARNKSVVGEDEHEALKAKLNDPEALRARLRELLEQSGETMVGV